MQENGLTSVIRNLKERIIEPLGWLVHAETVVEPLRVARLEVETGRKVLTMEVRYYAALIDLFPKKKSNGECVIFGTRHLGKTMVERFKAAGISVIDESGNYFFSYQNGEERVWAFEFGNKSEVKRQLRVEPFSPKASFVAMALLHAPLFSIPTMRDLQKATGISLGGLNSICKTMKERKLITYSRSEPIRVVNPSRFLDEFASYYKLRLAPKFQRKGYVAVKKRISDKGAKEITLERVNWRDIGKILQETLQDVLLTGVQAAQSETSYYETSVGEFLVADIKTAENVLKQHFQVSPTIGQADFIFISPYNSSALMYPREQERTRLANKIQVYLDLIASDDLRANELGAIYREKAIGY